MPRTRRETPFGSYLREINATPLLTADQERQLAKRIADGDQAARDHLIKANLRLVVNIAKRFAGRGIPFEDLIAEGNIALFRASELFDPGMQTRFSTYGSFWIRQAIGRFIIKQRGRVKVPASAFELAAKWDAAARAMMAENGRWPTEDEIAGRMMLSPRKKRIALAAIAAREIWPTGGGLGDRSEPQSQSAAPDAAAGTKDDARLAHELLEQLAPLERDIIISRFGIRGGRQTLRQIAERNGYSHGRIEQIEKRTLAKLRAEVGAC